jgi:hypothetical protein
MFCPNCGRNNPRETKFCASCGTNLEAVSQALSGDKSDFFTKTEAALDQLIARYSEHVFKDAPSKLADQKVSNSWKVLGQGAVTSFVDIILFGLMWNILPLRFLILLISTPIRLLAQRSNRQASAVDAFEEDRKRNFDTPEPNRWLPGSLPSISEHTTQNLEERAQPERKRVIRKE